MLTLAQLKPGDVIAYRLLPEDMPLNPNKVWRGKVVRVDNESVLVEMLEDGYTGLTEYVVINQITGIEISSPSSFI